MKVCADGARQRKANDAVRELIAKGGVPKSRVTLVRGATSRKKVFEIKSSPRERDAAG